MFLNRYSLTFAVFSAKITSSRCVIGFFFFLNWRRLLPLLVWKNTHFLGFSPISLLVSIPKVQGAPGHWHWGRRLARRLADTVLLVQVFGVWAAGSQSVALAGGTSVVTARGCCWCLAGTRPSQDRPGMVGHVTRDASHAG